MTIRFPTMCDLLENLGKPPVNCLLYSIESVMAYSDSTLSHRKYVVLFIIV